MLKKRYKKGDIIIQEGTSGKEIFVILKGKARVFKTIDRKKVELSILTQDDFFGEMSLFLQTPRTASVEAMEPTEVMFSNRKDFEAMVKEDPDIAVHILTTMAKRLTEAHNVIIQLEGEKKSLKVMYGIK